MTANSELATLIHGNEYLRERLSPCPNDHFYLCLSDLLLALRRFILDYGCGGSPYRSLFPNADYKRADYLQAGGDSLDYILSEDSRVPERDERFDLVLSTQVAEHLGHPDVYFSECSRLLKPEGRLICSTHGYFPDHGCPHDFQRWTGDGITRDLKKAGFEVEQILKLTSGSRAFFSIVDFLLADLRFSRVTPLGLSLFALSKIFRFTRSNIYRSLDSLRGRERVVDVGSDNSSFYIGLMAIGKKSVDNLEI
jgi:SAM-dependent methyltransferase